MRTSTETLFRGRKATIAAAIYFGASNNRVIPGEIAIVTDTEVPTLILHDPDADPPAQAITASGGGWAFDEAASDSGELTPDKWMWAPLPPSGIAEYTITLTNGAADHDAGTDLSGAIVLGAPVLRATNQSLTLGSQVEVALVNGHIQLTARDSTGGQAAMNHATYSVALLGAG